MTARSQRRAHPRIRDLRSSGTLTSDFRTEVFFAGESKTIWVAVRPLSATPVTLRVHLLAKQRDADAFDEVCSTRSGPFQHDDARLVGFTLPRNVLRWRIQIDQLEQSAAPVGMGLIVFTSVEPEQESTPRHAAQEGLFDYVCLDDKDPVLQAALKRLKPTFLERDIAVSVDPGDIELSDEQMSAMQEEFTRALETWHIASKLPQLGGITVVFRSGTSERILLNARLAQYLRARGLPKWDLSNPSSVAFYKDLDIDLFLTTLRRFRTSDSVDGSDIRTNRRDRHRAREHL